MFQSFCDEKAKSWNLLRKKSLSKSLAALLRRRRLEQPQEVHRRHGEHSEKRRAITANTPSRDTRVASQFLNGLSFSLTRALVPIGLLALAVAACGQTISIEEYKPKSTLVVPANPSTRAKFPFVDVHGHPRGTLRPSAWTI